MPVPTAAVTEPFGSSVVSPLVVSVKVAVVALAVMVTVCEPMFVP